MVKIWERARKRTAKTSKCMLLQPASSQALSPSNKDPNEMLQEKRCCRKSPRLGEGRRPGSQSPGKRLEWREETPAFPLPALESEKLQTEKPHGPKDESLEIWLNPSFLNVAHTSEFIVHLCWRKLLLPAKQ